MNILPRKIISPRLGIYSGFIKRFYNTSLMPTVLVAVADGSEEIETMTIVDVLLRADV